MLKAATLFVITTLVSILVEPIFDDAIITLILGGILFVILAPLVFDRPHSSRTSSANGERIR